MVLDIKLWCCVCSFGCGGHGNSDSSGNSSGCGMSSNSNNFRWVSSQVVMLKVMSSKGHGGGGIGHSLSWYLNVLTVEL